MSLESQMPTLPLAAGQVIAGRYELQAELGRGGMGAVWAARNLALDAPCAIKFMHSELIAEVDLRRRFLREARAVAQLRSPYIVTVFDVGEWNGWPYMAMELLEGETLEQRLQRDTKLVPTLTLEIVTQVARGLEAAHAAGLVHRDLKPENVFLSRVVHDSNSWSTVKILDFGVAKHLDATSGVKTAHGALLGTPHYMSPEQVRGDDAIDHRSDVWSLAVLTYECLTGRLPFSGSTVGAILGAIALAPIPPAPMPSCEEFWRRASERDRERRFQSAGALAEALRVALQADATLLATPAPAESKRGPARLRTPLAAATLVTFLAAGLLALRSREPTPVPTAQAADTRSQPSGFALESEPAGAIVFIDDIALPQPTPLQWTGIAAGTHTIRLQRAGYREHAFTFAQPEGAMITLPKAMLQQLPAPVAAEVVRPASPVSPADAVPPPQPKAAATEPTKKPAVRPGARPKLGKYDDLIGF